jgi:hypothetical protein
MDSTKEQQIVDLIKNRPDLDYVKIALHTNSNVTAVRKVARDNDCKRKRGGGPKKSIRSVASTFSEVTLQ